MRLQGLQYCIALASVAHALVPGHNDQTTFRTGNINTDSSSGQSLRFQIADLPNHSLRLTQSFDTSNVFASSSKQDPICTNSSYTGYLDVTDSHSLFFWFFPSKKPEPQDFIIWLSGGPGCSSTGIGNLFELGPCAITANGTMPNDYSWNDEADLMFIDSPAGVGYSTNNGRGIRTSEETAQDILALTLLFYHAVPEFHMASKSLHISGESYGGRYVPLVGDAIRQYNVINPTKPIKLDSIMIGNGMTAPAIQFLSTPKMAGCVPEFPSPYPIWKPESKECSNLITAASRCEKLVKACYYMKSPLICTPATTYCFSKSYGDFQKTGLNIYDVRKKCEGKLCYDQLDWVESYMNRADVKKAIGARPDVDYINCNMDVYKNMMFLEGDGMHDSSLAINPLLQAGVRVLVYAGMADFILNAIGISDWVEQIDTIFFDEYQSAPKVEWMSNGKLAGYVRKAGPGAGNLTFVAVAEAGHMVPYDQPTHALEMVHKWVHQKAIA